MGNIEWESVDVMPQSKPKGTPTARITSNSIAFNGAAAGLVEDIAQYPWVVVRVGRVNGKAALLGFTFVEEEIAGAFPVKKQSKKHKGVAIFSRELIKRYILQNFIGLALLQRPVEKLDDTTLAIHLPAVNEELDDALKAVETQMEATQKYVDNLDAIF